MSKTFMGITNSLSGKQWAAPVAEETLVSRMMSLNDNITDPMARVLVNRGISPEAANDFITNQFDLSGAHNPMNLEGMQALIPDLAGAIIDGKTFGICGDFDVDGVSSAVMLRQYLELVSAPVWWDFPNRVTEGRGPIMRNVAHLKQSGAEVIFFVDCGIQSHDIVASANKMGMQTIILDHHEVRKHFPEAIEPESLSSEEIRALPDDLPPANHIINPQRGDDTSGMQMMCAGGIVFMTLLALNEELEQRQYFSKNNIQKPDLKQFLDLLALGTVADVMALQGINRPFVKYGLSRLTARVRPGIAALSDVMGRSGQISVKDIGWSFGPPLNAISRMDGSPKAAELLLTQSEDQAIQLAHFAKEMNDKRQEVQKRIYEAVEEQIVAQNLAEHPVIIVDIPNALQGDNGLAGIVAGRLREKYNRPVIVVSYEGEDGIGRGSGRAPEGTINLGDVIGAAVRKDILLGGGGHERAGGLQIAADTLPRFREYVLETCAHLGDTGVMNAALPIDGISLIQGATLKAAEQLQKAGPYGEGHKEATLAFPNVRVQMAKVIGEKQTTIKCRLVDQEGGGGAEAIIFGAVEKPVGKALLEAGQSQRSLHIAGQLDVNEWQGRRTPQIMISDVAEVSA